MTESLPTHHRMANALRALAMDAVEAAQSGHPGLPMGMADVVTVLHGQILRFDPARPDWPDRDRFILSAGHGSMLLYALAHLAGYQGMPMEELRRFRQFGSRTPGHPEHDIAIGVETTTGPLGQGFATAIGMAIAERHLAARFGQDLVDHRVYVLASDGDLMEGLSHESASLAGHLRLQRLIVLWDDNRISIDGPTDLTVSEDTLARFQAYGWQTSAVDGHDPAAILAALESAQAADRPVLIACRTTIGYGAPTKAGKASSHGAPLGATEIAGARAALGWEHPPFEIPDDVATAWAEAGRRCRPAREAWEQRLQALPAEQRDAFDRALSGQVAPAHLESLLESLKAEFRAKGGAIASRASSGRSLAVLKPAIPELLGGSADLSGSNVTAVKDIPAFSAANPAGRYLHYGIREHAMVAAMNGMALHGGVIPYGGTFLTFTDYCRPAIRLACLMRQRIILVMTHDSIGLGEDGPTHQPVEHLAALRVMPDLLVLRPADAVETAEAWAVALAREDGPSLLSLTRQNLPLLRKAEDGGRNLTAMGGYVLAPAEGLAPAAVLLATGSEVAIAMAARERLQAEGVPTQVSSIPSFELLRRQDPVWIAQVLGPETALRAGIEAGMRQGWDEWIGRDGLFFGMTGFGASGPFETLYQHYGITAEHVAAEVARRLRD